MARNEIAYVPAIQLDINEAGRTQERPDVVVQQAVNDTTGMSDCMQAP